ncbi:MAG TPA: hypothetical protein VLI05_05970 [Candidatus Saccharimonadia bacterium]|nr:hypothetical protein [Candidatus Saccharimonadia bacterium]
MVFWAATGVVLVLNAGLIALFSPYVIEAARGESDRLAAAGRQAQGSEAQLDFELAHRLDPRNQTAALALAQRQLVAGQSDLAIQTLRAAGQGTEVLRLQLRTQLELGRTADAAVTAGQLAARSPSADDAQLAGLAYLVAGQPQSLPSLVPRLAPPEAAQRLQAAQADNLALGRELYATGLLQSSERLLMKQPSSTTRDVILGTINAARATPGSQATARDFYAAALQLDPTNRPARQGLIATLRALKDDEAADKQTALQAQLDAGRP